MSKTRGNVLDPLELIDIYGADALRFALTTGNSPGNDMRLNESKLEASRNFANKLWNAARFVLSRLEDAQGLEGWHQPRGLHRHDRWILSRLDTVCGQANRYMEEYQFGEAQRVIHDFLWSEYCDWYIEMAKVRLRDPAGHGEDGAPPSPVPVLAYVLEKVLRLLHPFMPFITEEIWRTLMEYLPQEPRSAEALIVAPYPQPGETPQDGQAELEVKGVVDLTRAIRNVRAEFRVPASQHLGARAYVEPRLIEVYEQESGFIQASAGVRPLSIGSIGDAPTSGEAAEDEVVQVLEQGTVHLSLGGSVDLQSETERLGRELADLSAYSVKLSARLRNEGFLSKAPEEVVDRERQRLATAQQRSARVQEILSRLGAAGRS